MGGVGDMFGQGPQGCMNTRITTSSKADWMTLYTLQTHDIYSSFHRLRCPYERLARALTPSLWTPPLRSHTPLLPSTMETSSSATFWANWPLPLPLVLRLLAASSIHWTACRRRCLIPIGTGICNAIPPPAAPFCDLIRRRGATESIASVR